MNARVAVAVLAVLVLLGGCEGGSVVGGAVDDSGSGIAPGIGVSADPTMPVTEAPPPSSTSTIAESSATDSVPERTSEVAEPVREAGEPTQEGESVAPTTVPASILDPILADAAERVGSGALSVEVAESVTWADGSLGCPQPGVSYVQVLTPGYRVVVAGDGTSLDYRADARGTFRLCERPTLGAPPSQDS